MSTVDYKELDNINIVINNKITYTPDKEQYNQDDWWEDASSTNKGDCEDYAIAKVRLLITRGYKPVEEVKLGLCWVENDLGYHAVCVAKASDGKWYVLDNRYPHAMPFELLPYKWDRWGLGKTWYKMEI